MEQNKNLIIIISLIVIFFIIGSYNVYKEHINKLYLVLDNEIKEAGKKCYLEKQCEGEITLDTLIQKGYIDVVVDPISKEEISKDKCLKYENDEIIFCN